MDWRKLVITGTVVTFAGGAIAHTYLHPFDPKKEHDKPTGIYTRISTLSPNLTIVGSGTDTRITPGTGALFFGSGNHEITPGTGSLIIGA